MKIGLIEFDLYQVSNSYNDANTNERMVEIPIAKWFIDKYQSNLIEVGAVTPYYFDIMHSVYDITDKYKNSIRIDAKYLSYNKKNLLSISTIEHVGIGHYSPEIDLLGSINLLNKMMESENYLITFPYSVNRELDSYVNKMNENIIRLKRVEDRKWEQVETMDNIYYNCPFNCGNGLIIITNQKELL